ncbi:MAG: metal-dependent hydrolase [Planctomycetota bacterium]|nr:MAG: metal-dependent hydrolase [Planctomycetota bacterium]
MPSVITHSLVGVVAGREMMGKNTPKRFLILSAVCPSLPDLDIIGFWFGVAYGDFFGHRGFFHSPFFALLLSILVVCVFFRDHKFLSRPWCLLVGIFFIINASHGLLDAFTNGGLGIALLSPFDSSRYFFPFRPILASPIGIETIFNRWRLMALISEIKWVWLPLGLLILAIRIIRAQKSEPT